MSDGVGFVIYSVWLYAVVSSSVVASLVCYNDTPAAAASTTTVAFGVWLYLQHCWLVCC